MTFEGIQFDSAQQARRIAAAAGGCAVKIGVKSYVVPKKEVARIRATGVAIAVIFPVAVTTPNRRCGIPEYRISERSVIAR